MDLRKVLILCLGLLYGGCKPQASSTPSPSSANAEAGTQGQNIVAPVDPASIEKIIVLTNPRPSGGKNLNLVSTDETVVIDTALATASVGVMAFLGYKLVKGGSGKKTPPSKGKTTSNADSPAKSGHIERHNAADKTASFTPRSPGSHAKPDVDLDGHHPLIETMPGNDPHLGENFTPTEVGQHIEGVGSPDALAQVPDALANAAHGTKVDLGGGNQAILPPGTKFEFPPPPTTVPHGPPPPSDVPPPPTPEQLVVKAPEAVPEQPGLAVIDIKKSIIETDDHLAECLHVDKKSAEELKSRGYIKEETAADKNFDKVKYWKSLIVGPAKPGTTPPRVMSPKSVKEDEDKAKFIILEGGERKLAKVSGVVVTDGKDRYVKYTVRIVPFSP